jgi:threonine synthase
MKILSTQREKAQLEEIFAAPEGAATLAVLAHLQYQGWVKPREQILLGTRLKHT